MKIFIIGYGKMGKMIESLAAKAGHEIVAVVDAGQFWPRFTDDDRPDVAIEFTQPDEVSDNLKHCIEWGIPVVTGTTGWEDSREEIRNLCLQKNAAVMFGSNYSIGVNVWFNALKAVAAGLATTSGYQVSIDETHHVNKKDKPSGTAITAANLIYERMQQYDGWSLKDENNKIHIEAHRRQDVTGMHSVLFSSEMDEVELVHRAHSREGFAKGAIRAAEWLCNKKGFFDFSTVFEEIFAFGNK
ncbi:MAG: 4-hydroxy-tetrahydrodipicolinate reductase [Bacteroidales bacterium]|jgi:4-hydroxy-tetrahydrodipicolinate reductase|nr:4-hydroxy-tetrahydrodipicolinate reductase [Bacteroidales bacterium]HPB02294.1 4-hydroxy-tetrahydrodipicolinate reductase [Bacteroidales bacterium]